MEVETMEVNRRLREVCGGDEFWKFRANSAPKAFEERSRKQNALYAENNLVCLRPLCGAPAFLQGDVIIIDPSRIFGRTPEGVCRLEKLQQQLQDLQRKGHWEFLLMYKGQIAYFISSESWDQDTAFEISRSGKSLGCDEVPSRLIAVVTKKMLDILLEENLKGMTLEGGVSVEGVDGQLICSGDGDFVISGSGAASPLRKVSSWIEDDCVRSADILCTAGGRWTFDDSSDEDDELSYDEELKMDGQRDM